MGRQVNHWYCSENNIYGKFILLFDIRSLRAKGFLLGADNRQMSKDKVHLD